MLSGTSQVTERIIGKKGDYVLYESQIITGGFSFLFIKVPIIKDGKKYFGIYGGENREETMSVWHMINPLEFWSMGSGNPSKESWHKFNKRSHIGLKNKKNIIRK